jgi:hypothetical protein
VAELRRVAPIFGVRDVRAALRHYERLGFAPHRDFPEKIFGPRPEALADTPWIAEERPLYVAGPRDDVDGILATLDASVGVEGYDFVDPVEGDAGEWEEEDEDVIEVEAMEKPAEGGAAVTAVREEK